MGEGRHFFATLFLCFSNSYLFATLFCVFRIATIFATLFLSVPGGCPKVVSLFFPAKLLSVFPAGWYESCLWVFFFLPGSGRWVRVAVCVVSKRVWVIGPHGGDLGCVRRWQEHFLHDGPSDLCRAMYRRGSGSNFHRRMVDTCSLHEPIKEVRFRFLVFTLLLGLCFCYFLEFRESCIAMLLIAYLIFFAKWARSTAGLSQFNRMAV